MNRTVLIAISGLALAVTLASAACAPQASKPTTASATRPPAAITAVVLAIPGSWDQLSPKTIWTVGLEGAVSTRSVPAASGSDLALSPDGRTLLYNIYPRRKGDPPGSLHAMDLDTGSDTSMIASSDILSFGWDSTGRAVALTGKTGWGWPGPVDDLTVWHGLPSSFASASAEATMPADALILVASDGRTAYFEGFTRQGSTMGDPSSIDHLWRYDFVTHKLALARSVFKPNNGTPQQELLVPSRAGSYEGAPPYPWNLPGTGLANEKAIVSTGALLMREIELMRYSDLKLARSVIVTFTPPAADENVPGSVFDATFTHYIQRSMGLDSNGKDLPSRIVEVDTATGRQTLVNWPPDQLAWPIGYLGSTRSFLFMSTDLTSANSGDTAVVLQDPGKKPRIILHLRGSQSARTTLLGLLGVRHAK